MCARCAVQLTRFHERIHASTQLFIVCMCRLFYSRLPRFYTLTISSIRRWACEAAQKNKNKKLFWNSALTDDDELEWWLERMPCRWSMCVLFVSHTGSRVFQIFHWKCLMLGRPRLPYGSHTVKSQASDSNAVHREVQRAAFCTLSNSCIHTSIVHTGFWHVGVQAHEIWTWACASTAHVLFFVLFHFH